MGTPTKKRSQFQRYINATASLSDVMLASQAPDRHSHNSKPEHKLFAATLYDAINRIDRVINLNIPPPMKRTVQNYRKRTQWDYAKEAYQWVMGEEGQITSEQACFAAGLDIDYFRGILVKFVKKHGKAEFFQSDTHKWLDQ